MLRTQLASGRLLALRRGVFIDASAWPDDLRGRHLVRAHAEQVANPEAVLSHGSAALVWDLPYPGFGQWWDAMPAVTLPSKGHRSRSTAARHHRGPLPAAEVTRDAEGYPVTTVARTAVDLVIGCDLPEALVVLDGAARTILASFVTQVRRRDYANPRLVGAARALLRQSMTTRRSARLLAMLALVEPGRESAAESLSAGHINLAGLPMPAFQAEVRTAAGSFFPDCLWAEHHLIGECDGAVKYRESDAYVREKEREQVLRDLGFRFVRWQAKEIMLTPGRVIDRIGRELAA